jgi:hypothetical protein
MALIDHRFFLERHVQTAESFPQGIVESHFFDAELTVRRWVGENTWQGVLDLEEKDPAALSTEEEIKLEAFKRAAAELTMMCLIPKMNLKIGGSGIIVSSFSQEFGSGNFKIASQEEITKLQEQYEIRALELLEEWKPQSTPVVGKKAAEAEEESE